MCTKELSVCVLSVRNPSEGTKASFKKNLSEDGFKYESVSVKKDFAVSKNELIEETTPLKKKSEEEGFRRFPI